MRTHKLPHLIKRPTSFALMKAEICYKAHPDKYIIAYPSNLYGPKWAERNFAIMYKNVDGTVEDSFQAFLVDGANFTNEEEYPIIENWMVPQNPPEKIMSFEKAICYRGDLSEYYVSFYSRDPSFERIRKNPKKYLHFFKRCKGIIGFDYSVHSDMPIVKQKSQLNDNLSLSFFFAKNGIPLIPNCRGGSDCLNEDYLSAFPKNSYVALGVHGFIKESQQKLEWVYWISKLIDALNPKGFVVVGHLPSEIIDSYKDRAEFIQFNSFMEDRSEALTYGN